MRRIGLIGAAAGLCALAGAAAAQTPGALKSGVDASGGLMIAMGDRMIVRLGEDWRPTLDRIEPATDPTKASVGAGEVALSFGHDPKLGTILVVQNRTARTLRYQVRMAIVRDGKLLEAPTSTCPVRPGVFDFENWPQALDAVHVLSFSDAGPDMACR